MTQVLKLQSPVTWDGKQVDKLEFNFDTLKGRDIANLTRIWRVANKGAVGVTPTFDLEFCVIVACFSAGYPKEFADELRADDWTEAAYHGQVFLNKMDLKTPEGS